MARLHQTAATDRGTLTSADDHSEVRRRPRAEDDVFQVYDSEDDDDAKTRAGAYVLELARLSDPRSVPRRTRTNVHHLPLHARAGFVLWAVDDKASVGEIVDTCPMSEDEVLRVLAELIELRIITLA